MISLETELFTPPSNSTIALSRTAFIMAFEELEEGHDELFVFQSALLQISPELVEISWSLLKAAHDFVLFRVNPLCVYSAFDLCFQDHPSDPAESSTLLHDSVTPLEYPPPPACPNTFLPLCVPMTTSPFSSSTTCLQDVSTAFISNWISFFVGSALQGVVKEDDDDDDIFF